MGFLQALLMLGLLIVRDSGFGSFCSDELPNCPFLTSRGVGSDAAPGAKAKVGTAVAPFWCSLPVLTARVVSQEGLWPVAARMWWCSLLVTG